MITLSIAINELEVASDIAGAEAFCSKLAPFIENDSCEFHPNSNNELAIMVANGFPAYAFIPEAICCQDFQKKTYHKIDYIVGERFQL